MKFIKADEQQKRYVSFSADLTPFLRSIAHAQQYEICSSVTYKLFLIVIISIGLWKFAVEYFLFLYKPMADSIEVDVMCCIIRWQGLAACHVELEAWISHTSCFKLYNPYSLIGS